MATDTIRHSTSLSVGIYFGQTNYLYDPDYVQDILTEKLTTLCRAKGISVQQRQPSGWGASGGGIGFIEGIVSFYQNNTILVSLLMKLPLLLKIAKFIVLLPTRIHNHFTEREWQKYQKSHRYSHSLNIDLYAWSQPQGASTQLTRDSVIDTANQLLLILPEIKGTIEAVYPEFDQNFILTVASATKSKFIIQMRDFALSEKHRLLMLHTLSKNKDDDYPLCIRVGKSRVGYEKVVVHKNADVMSGIYTVETK